MQEERLRLRGLRVGALPILNRFIERMGLEEELTLALKNRGYADALLAATTSSGARSIGCSRLTAPPYRRASCWPSWTASI